LIRALDVNLIPARSQIFHPGVVVLVGGEKGVADAGRGVRLHLRVATVSEWKRLGLPGKKVSLVAEFFGAPGYLFLDTVGVSDETFIARIEQASVSARTPEPSTVSRYEEILANYKDSDDLPDVLANNGFNKGRIVEYAANELNKTEYRKKSINVLLGLNPTEEQLYRIASSDNIGRLLLNNNFLRMFDEEQFEFLKVAFSQRIAECLFRHRYNKLIHVVNYLVNTAGAIKTDVFRHAVYFRQITSRKLAINALLQQNDQNRLTITWLLKDGMEDSWGVRDEIGSFVTNLVEQEAFYSAEEEQTAEKLLDWVLHKAKWKVDKPYKANFETAYETLRQKRSA
jgi:hypothetical protein